MLPILFGTHSRKSNVIPYPSKYGLKYDFFSFFFAIVNSECVCVYIYIYIYIYTHTPDIGIMVRVFANGPEDLGSIPGQVIPKTQKMVLDAILLNTQHYKGTYQG